jgi:N-acyl-D-amino-acid deacylase
VLDLVLKNGRIVEIWIAERNEVPLQISHLKAAGRSNWGSITRAMELVE